MSCLPGATSASGPQSANSSFDEPAARLLPLQNSVRKLRSGKDFGRRRKQAITGDEYRRVYLFLFNLFQLVGFIYLLVVLSIRYAKDGSKSTESSYRALGFVIKSLYTVKLLELLHTAIGLTYRSLLCNALQSIWHLFIIVAVIDGQPQVHTEHLTLHLLLVYTLLELFRLPYTCLRALDVRIRLLAIIQANARLVLQPIAMLLEATLLYKALPLFEHNHAYSLYLPNSINVSFHMPTFIRLYLLLGLFPFCYLTLARLLFYRSSIQQNIAWKKTAKHD